MGERRVRREPRVTVHALAQYLCTAGPGRRETILRRQKFPATFQTNWYAHANRAIVRYLLDPDRDAEILTAAAGRIRAMPADGRNEAQKLRDNAAAVSAFADCCDDIDHDQLESQRAPQVGSLLMEGVTISVRPDVILSGNHRGARAAGGIKVYLSKNDRLGPDGCAAAGAILNMFVDRTCPAGATASPRHSLVVDVFGGECSSAPRAVLRRRRDIDIACRDIARQWPHIQARGD